MIIIYKKNAGGFDLLWFFLVFVLFKTKTKIIQFVSIFLMKNLTNANIYSSSLLPHTRQKNILHKTKKVFITNKIWIYLSEYILKKRITYKKIHSGGFDLLFYTDKELEAPDNWEDSNPCMIKDGQNVQLKSFSTSIHKVDGSVSYKFNM